MRMEGIFTPIITPQLEDGSIDKESYVEVAEFLISSGIHCIVIGGSTGEYYTQTLEERIEITKPDTIYFDPVDDIVYVAGMEQQISIYTLDGELLSCWGGGKTSNRAGEFSGCPHGLWMDSRGDLYVGQVQVDAGLQKFVRMRA